MPGSAYGNNPETANRILEVIRKHLDKKGFWEARSLSKLIAEEIKLGERTVEHYLRLLKRMGLIAMTKAKKREQPGWYMVDRLKLLKPNHVVVKQGELLAVIEP